MPRRRAWRLTEPPPPRATPLAVQDGIRRIVAPNPGPMTYHGTNTWLVDWQDGVVAIDPGSDDPSHLDAIMTEAGGRLSHILLTHTHRDHLTGTAELAQLSGAATCGYRISADAGFDADIKLDEGSRIAGLTALHTPGHAMDHLCFAHDDGILFSGDHVMGWSTSVVPPPPSGDLKQFISSLERVRDLDHTLMLSAHGPAITDPQEFVQTLLDHRAAREHSIEVVLKPQPTSFDSILARAYYNLKPELLTAARNNLLSHLLKLEAEGRALSGPDGWRAAG